jgi:hypothetical protein
MDKLVGVLASKGSEIRLYCLALGLASIDWIGVGMEEISIVSPSVRALLDLLELRIRTRNSSCGTNKVHTSDATCFVHASRLLLLMVSLAGAFLLSPLRGHAQSDCGGIKCTNPGATCCENGRSGHCRQLSDECECDIRGGSPCGSGGSYSVAADVTGLTGGTLTMQDNNGTPVSISSNGTYTLASHVDNNMPYAVTIASQPTAELCRLGSNSNGHVNGANVVVPVTCTTTSVPTGTMNYARRLHTATRLLDGTVLIAGGQGTNSTLASAELYDPLSRSFRPTRGQMMDARASHTATLLNNGMVLIVGGDGTTGTTNKCTASTNGALLTAELYNPKSETFAYTTNAKGQQTCLYTARGEHTATGFLHRTPLLRGWEEKEWVLIAGGNNGGPLAKAEVYDPETGAFDHTGDMHTARYTHRATLLSDKEHVLIAAGSGPNSGPPNGSILDSAELYDGLFFTAVPSKVYAHDYGVAALLTGETVAAMNGQVLIAGGLSPSTAPLSTADLYNPIPGTFITQPNGLMTPRVNATNIAVLLGDGTVLIEGGGSVMIEAGRSVPIILKSAELYCPNSNKFVPTFPMTLHRDEHTATLLSDGKTVLIAGGWSTVDGPALNSWELLSPAPGTCQ